MDGHALRDSEEGEQQASALVFRTRDLSPFVGASGSLRPSESSKDGRAAPAREVLGVQRPHGRWVRSKVGENAF